MTEPLEHPLEAIDWRLERAGEHLAALDTERDAFLDKKNGRIVGHFERDSSEYVFRFEGRLPDPRIGLIVGEFGHHLRAALDNLVWQLVRLRGGSPTWRTEYPIDKSRKRYRRKASRALRGVSADDRAAIERTQPFHHGERASQSYLALLAWLNNVDKHRFVHIGTALPMRTPIQVSYGRQGENAGQFPWNPIPIGDVKIIEVDYISSMASDDRAELARVRIETSEPNPEMEMDRDAPLEISMSDSQQALIIANLKEMRQVVGSIVDGFRPRFDI